MHNLFDHPQAHYSAIQAVGGSSSGLPPVTIPVMHTVQCPQVLGVTFGHSWGTLTDVDDPDGPAIPTSHYSTARAACSSAISSSAHSAEVQLPIAVILIVISLIPFRDRSKPGPDWWKGADDKWHPPTNEPSPVATNSHRPVASAKPFDDEEPPPII